MGEVESGINWFINKLQTATKLKVLKFRRLGDHGSYYILITHNAKQTDIVLSQEFLSDLPNTPEYQRAVDEYFGWLRFRMESYSPSEFYCKSGTPLKIEIAWPIQPSPNRAASFVHVYAYDLRFRGLVAKCSALITYQADWALRKNPFHREKAIVQAIRQSVDKQELAFYAEESHPSSLQQVHVETGLTIKQPVSESDIEQFLAGKVYWLAFKRGDQSTRIWVTDPWDAEYLGVDEKILRQFAQILKARKIIILHDDSNFASAGEGLLLGGMRFEAPVIRPQRVLLLSDSQSHDHLRNVVKDILPTGISLVDPIKEQGTSLLDDIRYLIERADLIIVDITFNNPNVMYELGFAHALKKTVAIVTSKDPPPKVPTDLASFRFLPYDLHKPEEFKQALRNYLESYLGAVRG